MVYSEPYSESRAHNFIVAVMTDRKDGSCSTARARDQKLGSAEWGGNRTWLFDKRVGAGEQDV
jgi:hypothetical protein